MTTAAVNSFQSQLDELIAEYKNFRGRSQDEDLSDVLDPIATQRELTRCLAAITRVSGENSEYSKSVKRLVSEKWSGGYMYMRVVGIVESLAQDLKAGYLQSLSQLIHADVFADFLEMADHLLEQDYKDAAAVIVGSSLEAHLRKLCIQNNIQPTAIKNGSPVPKKADVLNTELAAQDVYSKLDQKSVTAWLDLRNKAAHGNYSGYDSAQVRLMLDAVSNFMARLPA